VDVILEMRADVNLGKDLTVLAKNGRVVVIGSRGSVEMTPRDAMSREACIMGMSLFNCPSDDRAALHARLAEGFNNRAFAPVVGKTFALSDAAAAHHAVMAPGALGKIILHP
jgi:NADPH2:quinone reductase